MRIVVLMGGRSTEREVSLQTGKAVANGLRCLNHEVIEYDFDPSRGRGIEDLIRSGLIFDVDVVFIALHGGEGEDGRVQAALEILGVPYTGSGVEASVLCIDKIATKIFFEYYGLPTPKWFSIDDSELGEEIIQRIESIGGFPVVVKPSDQGSTVGISIVRKSEQVESAIEEAMRYSQSILVEEYIDGRELSVPLFNNEVFPIVEIRPRTGFYDYKHKYTKGETEYICPAVLDGKTCEQIKQSALKAFQLLGCSGIARVDVRLGEDGIGYLLEVNTIPGMTETSLVPMSAEVVGVSFSNLLERIVLDGVQRVKGTKCGG
ncbi:MAG: D-alanine--D-alanine ligase family protein [bacterium]